MARASHTKGLRDSGWENVNLRRDVKLRVDSGWQYGAVIVHTISTPDMCTSSKTTSPNVLTVTET